MSRSKKKPWYQDSGWKGYNKLFRRTNKIRVNQGKEPLLMNELVCGYDVTDWKSYCPEDSKAYRK